MPEEIPVEGLASWLVQELSQKQLAGCVLTKQTYHQQLSSRCFILHAFWEAGTVEAFDLVCNIILSFSTE